ncbi:MAG: hypothetical protein JNJ64_14480 [Flavobacteriales bacterium]|nr:hypothetical protein [Flavobacteriales bacterium]
MKRRLIASCIVGIAVLLGAVREFLFLNLNYQLDHLERGTPYSYAHSLFQRWTDGADLGDLTLVKWLLSSAYVALMLLLAVLLARVLTGHHHHRRTLVAGTAIAAALALLLHIAAQALPPLEAVAVKLLHALQYPVLLLILLLVLPRAERIRT